MVKRDKSKKMSKQSLLYLDNVLLLWYANQRNKKRGETNVKKIISMMLVLALVLSLCACTGTNGTGNSNTSGKASAASAEALERLNSVNWEGSTDTEQVKHHTYAEYQAMMEDLVAAYPGLCRMYSIGHTSHERELWCLEITNTSAKGNKTGIGVFGNIHGGEMESAESAMYTGYWMLQNSKTDEVKKILDSYIVYCIPMINPDGMEQSFIYNNRPNLSFRDADGDGIVFSDPYTDVNGDGFISNVYMAKSGLDTTAFEVKGRSLSYANEEVVSLGMESPDWNLDGKLGNDPCSSGIDMNRTFDYMFGAFNMEGYNPNEVNYTGYEAPSVIGNNAWSSNGQVNGPAYELEIEAVQNFLATHEMNALVTLHTGIQTVLWPWCYQEADYENNEDLVKMAEVGKAMAEKFAETASSDGTTRNFYYRSSWSDYPTSAEMIDYAYGRFGIHAYTIEVYSSGDSDPNTSSTDEYEGAYLNYDGTYSKGCTWQNGAQLENNAAEDIVEYTYAQVIGTGEGCLGFTAAQVEAIGLVEGQSLYFRTTKTAKMSGICPTNMKLMVEGAKDSILVMINAEPYGDGYTCPEYLKQN